jgi:hypothetical protein
MVDEEAIILPKHEATDNKICFRLNILKSIVQNRPRFTFHSLQKVKEKLRNMADRRQG